MPVFQLWATYGLKGSSTFQVFIWETIDVFHYFHFIGPFGSVTYKWSFGFHDFFSLLICYFWVNVHFGVGTVVSISWWILSRNSPLVCTNVLVLVRCISKFGLLILCGFMCRLCAVQWFWFQKYCYSCQINRLYI